MAETRKSVNSSLLVHLCAALVVVVWGVSFVSTRVIMDNGIGPVEIYYARFLAAYLLMLIISHKRFMSLSIRDELLFAVCGICGCTVYYLAENFALEYTLATNVSLITSLPPMLTMLLAGLIYRDDRPSRGAYAGSMVALIGVALVIFNSSFVMKVNPLGDFLALAAALSFAIYTLILRKVQAFYDAAFVTRKMFFYGLVTSLPFAVFSSEKFDWHAWTVPAVWGNFLFLTLCCTAAAFVTWSWAVGKLGVIKTNNYLYFQPVITLIFSAIVLSQPITVIGLAGCILILLGVYLADKLNMRHKSR